jgi:hypothetical protein
LLAAAGPVTGERSDAIPEGRDYGAGLTLDRPAARADLVQDPDRFTQAPVLVRGRIADVCQRKGCWTVLRDGTTQVRVRFKDYGFFLPKDCVGQQAFVEGMLRVETLSEDAARHYDEESRSPDPDRVRGPRREIGITASGVRLLERE